MQVSKPNQYTLIITKSRLGLRGILDIIITVFISLIFFLFYTFGFLFKDIRFREEVIDFLYKNSAYIFNLVVLVVLLSIKISNVISLIVKGEEYTFDGLTKMVLKNKKYYVSFSDIAHLEVRTPFFGTRITPNITNIREHILQARLQSLKKFHIHTSENLSEICALADDIGNIIGIGVVRTEL